MQQSIWNRTRNTSWACFPRIVYIIVYQRLKCVELNFAWPFLSTRLYTPPNVCSRLYFFMEYIIYIIVIVKQLLRHVWIMPCITLNSSSSIEIQVELLSLILYLDVTCTIRYCEFLDCSGWPPFYWYIYSLAMLNWYKERYMSFHRESNWLICKVEEYIIYFTKKCFFDPFSSMISLICHVVWKYIFRGLCMVLVIFTLKLFREHEGDS